MLLSNKNSGSTIHVKFEIPEDKIFYILQSTGQEGNVTAVSGVLKLIKNRIYYIPVDNKNIDSDNFSVLKVFSSLADKIDIKFIKEGFACIIPILHNTIIKNNQQLCVILD